MHWLIDSFWTVVLYTWVHWNAALFLSLATSFVITILICLSKKEQRPIATYFLVLLAVAIVVFAWPALVVPVLFLALKWYFDRQCEKQNASTLGAKRTRASR